MAEHPLFHSFQEFNNKHRLIERGEKILVCVSGGIDSMVLLHLLCKLQKRLKIELAAAHFNHQLRSKESDDDETFVRAASADYGIECFVETANTRLESEKLSLQEAARNLRYSFFNRIRQSSGCRKIATAHNADDNAETILLNLFRGAGVHGMTGIPIFRNDRQIIRPLLFASRERIQEYSKTQEITFREDSSNLKDDYTRNFLRHQILPLIRGKINPDLTTVLERTGVLFSQLEDYIGIEAQKVAARIIENGLADELIINLSVFNEQPVFLRGHILLHLGKQFAGPEIDFNSVESMMKISQSGTGGYCNITKDVVLYHDRNRLIFKNISRLSSYCYHVELNNKYHFDTFGFCTSMVSSAELSDNPNIEFIDADKIGKELTIRSWREGDRFVPIGMSDNKKVSDFFIDQKIPLFEKESIPIFISGDHIIWICGKRLDDRFKITPDTSKIIKLEYIQGNKSS